MPNVSADTREADAQVCDDLLVCGIQDRALDGDALIRLAYLSRHAAKVQEARNFLQGSLDIAGAFERPVVFTHNETLGLIHLLDAMLAEPDA